jgi:hypothetical protein
VWSRKRTKKTSPDFIFTIKSLNILYHMQQEYDTFFPVHRLYILILCTHCTVQSLEWDKILAKSGYLIFVSQPLASPCRSSQLH